MVEQTNDKLIATIQGDLEGFPVVVYIHDSDLNDVSEDGVISGLGNIEVGVFQYYLGQMLDHGLVAPFRKKTSDSSQNVPESFSASWTCRFHGNKAIYDSKFTAGKKTCGYYEIANSFDAPDWSSGKVVKHKTTGENRYYCKEKEA